MEAIELDHVGSAEWNVLIDGEQSAWGGGAAEQLDWAVKQRHVGVRDGDGWLIALASALVADLEAGGERFPVVGIGSVIVTHSHRGEGLAPLVIEAILAIARTLGPARAMLFCRDELTALYARFGFELIAGEVTAEQPNGRIVVPMNAMWAPLEPGAGWPPGDVAVLGPPF